MINIQEKLFELQDLGYKEFHAKLIPTVEPDTIIGVRTPELRKFAKEINKSEEKKCFMSELPHKYYEENNLHGFLIEYIKDYDEAVRELDIFLPYVDNWATCDMMAPKVLAKYPDRIIPKVKEWIASDDTYSVRFAIGVLMSFFLDEKFDVKYLEMVASVKSEEYYIKMMIAWYFATALAKQYEQTLPYIKEGRLERWVHNKSIQKAVESNRISKDTKEYLKMFKIK